MANTKSNNKIKFKRYVILFFLLIFAYIVSLILTCMIPRSKVVSNIEKSRVSILQQGINKPLLFNSNAYILDTFSDGIMINMSYAVESSKPIKSALEGNQQILRNSANVSENLTNLFSDSITTNWSYGRYWHGWMVVIRPLLVFFDYSEIRYLNIIFMTLLLIIFLGMVYKYIGIKAEFSFILGFLLVNFWIVPLCLHYSSVFYLALIFGIILILLRNKPHIFGLCFFTVGSMTCFFDLLSAPMVTLGVCLVLTLLACIGFIPMIWYVIIGNHSQVHTRFTYRALISTIVSYIYISFVLIDKNPLIYLYKKFTRNKNI